MYFTNYEYFLTLVREKNVSKAADELCITQPALSKYLKRLENRIGASLVDRSTSPLKLTHIGGIYLRYATQIAQLDQQFQDELAEIQNVEHGTVAIGISQWRGSFVLPHVLPILLKRYPQINVTIVEGKTRELIDKLLNRKLDLCIMNLYSVTDPENLEWKKIADERVLLAANANHPLVQAALSNNSSGAYSLSQKSFPHFDITSLEHEQFVLMEDSSNITRVALEMFQKRGIVLQKIQGVENLVSALYHVSANMDFTFIPESGTYSNYVPENVVLFTVDEPVLSRPLSIITRRSEAPSRAAKIFMDVVHEAYGPY